MGHVALPLNNTTGNANTAIGKLVLWAIITGSANTAVGVDAMNNNTTGHDNTATGGAASGQHNRHRQQAIGEFRVPTYDSPTATRRSGASRLIKTKATTTRPLVLSAP